MMRHNRRRKNPVLTPEQVFSAVLADLSAEDSELAAYAYQNAPYFIDYARKAVGDGGSLTDDELIEQIRSTGQGISREDENIARDCMSAISPQARPADLLNRFLTLLSDAGTDAENRALIEFGLLARRYGFTVSDPMEITVEEAKEIVGYPECDEPTGGNAAHIAAFVEWTQSDWTEKAKKRAKGFGPSKRLRGRLEATERFLGPDWVPDIDSPEAAAIAQEDFDRWSARRPRRPRRTLMGGLMGGGPVDTRGGRRGGRGGRRSRRGWDEDDWIAWEEEQANKD
jgi:hypothetical protein